MSDLLRVAVVGCGYWGPNLVRNFAETPGFDLAGICDLDPARLDAISRDFRVRWTTTRFAEVLEDESIDVVALATPVATHRPLGEAALTAGKHLWVENPLAGSVADAEALVAAARRLDRQLLVDHTSVYTGAVQKIRQLVGRGDLGEVMYFDAVRVNLGLFQAEANVLWDLGPHDVSIAQYVLGRRPTEVSAIGVKHIDGARENMAYLTFRYDGGPLIAHFHLNWLAPVKTRLTMIGGTRKMLVYNDMETAEKLKIYDKGIDVASSAWTEIEARRRLLISYRSGDLWSPRLDATEALAVAARDFAASIREHRPPICCGEHGLDVVRTLAAAQRSLEANGAFVGV